MWGYVPPAGKGSSEVLVVAESADKESELEGSPLAGASGRLFNRLISRAGYERDSFRLANVLSCRPPDNKLSGEWYENKAIEACRPNLDAEIEAFKPKVVIALGDVALKRLTGFSGIMRYRGRPLPLVGNPGTWVVPTLHPSFLLPRQDTALRNPARYTGAVILDIKKAMHIREHGFERSEGKYLLDPGHAEFKDYILQYEAALRLNPLATFLSWDIETPWKMKNQDEGELDMKEAAMEAGDSIIRISFSFAEGTGTSVPYSPEYLEGIKRLLVSAGPKVGWNHWHFDEPKVRGGGVAINGESHDGMWQWHLYQPDLDKGLEFVSSFTSDLLPWKHLNQSDPVLYSAIDPDAALRNFLSVKRWLEKSGQWPLYLRHVVAMEKIWQKAGGAGVYIDIPKQNALREKLGTLEEEIIAKVQPLVPQEVKPRKRYKKNPWPKTEQFNDGRGLPKGVTFVEWNGRCFVPVQATGKIKVCSFCGAQGVTKTAHFKGGKKNACKVAGATIEERLGEVGQWDEILPFNPGSGPQLRAYIKHFNHPMGKDPKDREREVADAKHLKKLIKQYGDTHPIYKLILDYHKISKTKSTYLPPPDETGKIYTIYTNAPATWRTSSKAPSAHGANLQNWGKSEENKWAKLARETVIAKPGFVFVSADSKAVEALMTGWFMNDLNFMMLSAKGVYAWLLAKAHGKEIPAKDFTPEIGEQFKSIDKLGYRKKKVTTLGTLYGMNEFTLLETYSDDFNSIAEAKAEQEFLFAALPALKEWQTAVRVRAHKETFLQSPWGYRRYLYDVYVNQKNRWGVWVTKEGQGADKAVAMLPQNSNAAFQRDNGLLIAEQEPWLLEYLPANVFTHDSWQFEVPEALVERTADVLEQVMTRPIAEMNGLRVGTEIEVGRNWGDYSESNPDGMKAYRAVLIEPTEEMLPNYRKAA